MVNKLNKDYTGIFNGQLGVDGGVSLAKKFLSENKIMGRLPQHYTEKQKNLYFQKLKRDPKYSSVLMKRYVPK